MPAHIQNREQVATTPERGQILEIIAAGLKAVDTAEVMRANVHLDNGILHVKDTTWNLDDYRNIYVLGFGKASTQAAEAIEAVLGDRITRGATISLEPSATCRRIEVITGTHPLPSAANVAATQKTIEIARAAGEDDLVICIVSGGGSALMCGTTEEQVQGQRLYTAFLRSNGKITELNTVRKHISNVKGGGLAELLYPATVIGLVFSDIAGDNHPFIMSGPTYLDETTVRDAQEIISRYSLGTFQLNETPKDQKFFERVTNVVMVSNTEALESMRVRAEQLELRARVLSSALYVPAEEAIAELQASNKAAGDVVLAGGEIRMTVTQPGGTGGRCQYLGIVATQKIMPDETFCAFASDGTDNGDCAGAIIDAVSLATARDLGLNPHEYQDRFDGYTFCELLGHEQIFTGRTNANVADFMILLKK